jgi:uncharacterized protein YjbI with pentapeptide repeats
MNDTLRRAAPQGSEDAPASSTPEADGACVLRADDLRGRDLRGRDLTKVEGLLPEHLAGADLTGAKLPEEIAKFPALEQVRAISAEARKVFIGLLAACVYSWLVIGTTRDVQLLLNTAGSPLPIINTAIPIAGFYVVGATILAAVYCYLHFYLQRLWRRLASLPAIFPDGVELDDKSDPWLLTNLVRTGFTLLRSIPPPLARLENLLAVFLTWWLVPLTLLALWARYLPARGWLSTSWLVLLIGIATLFGRHTYRLALAALRGQTARTAEESGADGGILARAWRELRGLRLDKLSGGLTIGLIVCSISAFRDNPRDPYTWVVKRLNSLDFVGIRTYAYLREIEVAQKPEGWDGKDLRKVKRVDLQGRNLAFAYAVRAFLANADLRGADLAGAHLTDAQLEGAELGSAQLQGATLFLAQLQGAKLGAQHYQLEGATVFLRLQGPNLGAQLQGADLSFAKLQGADLTRAQLQGAILFHAQLQGANLAEAQLQGANLAGAQLQGANLTSAQLQGASLFHAQLQGADLTDAQLRGADLREAALWRILLPHADTYLVDQRASTAEPMTKTAASKAIADVAADILDESLRQRVVEQLTRALEIDDRPFYGLGPIRATEQAYEEELAKFLGDLACRDHIPEAQTRGLAARALDRLDEPNRLWPILFAVRVTGPDCPPAKGLSQDQRFELEVLAAESRPSKAAETIAPGSK